MEESEFMNKLCLPYGSPEANQRQIIDTVTALRDNVAELKRRINELNGKIHELKDELAVTGLHEHILQERLDAVIEVVGDEHLVERMVDDIETEDIIDAWIRATSRSKLSSSSADWAT